MMRKQQGFTLIELLISVTLLSLIMFTGNYVYMQLASRWDKELGSFEHDIEQTKAIYILQNLLEGVEPYLIKNSKGRPEMFFVGGEDSLLVMTKSGFEDTQNPELVRLTAVQNKQGRFDLVYQAISSADMLLINSEQNIEFTSQKTLLSELFRLGKLRAKSVARAGFNTYLAGYILWLRTTTNASESKVDTNKKSTANGLLFSVRSRAKSLVW